MFDLMRDVSLQELHFRCNGDLQAIIAIHSTALGPALGGCRFVEYEDTSSAVRDAVRLATGMSYKAAMAGVPHGGGKSVIMKPKSYDRSRLFELFGDFVNELGGRYITAMDSGTEVADMDIIKSITPFVASSSNIGDPSPYTAQGVVQGIKAAVEVKLKTDIKGLTIAIQGLGHVGFAMAEMLHSLGAKLIVSDVDANKVKRAIAELGAKEVSAQEILFQKCDVLAPCGLGGIINEQTVSKLDCQIVAGCANNQLDTKIIGDHLYEKGILYAPDYVINSGGLIFASCRYHEHTGDEALKKIDHLYLTLKELFERSVAENIAPHVLADRMAEEKLK
jgi:leucine dehydrogenase